MELVPRIEPAVSEIWSARGPLRVAEIRLGGVPRGAAVVLCDAGTLERDAAAVMNGLAGQGYESVAADLSAAVGRPAAGAAGTAAIDRALVDGVAVLVDRLAGRGWAPDQVGLVGYGLGGRAALLAAAKSSLGAAVSVAPTSVASPRSGTPAALDPVARPVRTPWLGMFAQEDPDAPPSAVRKLGEFLQARSAVHTEVVCYPGVTGAFCHESRGTLAHAASFDSWQRTVEWLNLRVVPRPTALGEAWRQRTRAARDGG